MLVLFDISSIALLLALILTPFVRNLANRLGLVDKPDATRKLHAGAVPRVGGIAVALSYALALAFMVVAPYRNLTVDIPKGLVAAWALAPAVAIVFAVGLTDDIRGLRPWQKLGGEAIAAVLAYHAGFGIHVLQGQAVSDWLSLPLTVLWLVGCTNALNLIDGMDGLAAGVGAFATLTAFVAALVHNSLELAIVTAPLVGALIGFLRYNFNPASIFLGDCGSLLIGFLLGCFGTIWSQKSATVLGMTAPLIAFAMPLLDTGLAILRRYLRRQPILSADRGHIHHRLLDQGMTPRRAAVMLYGACGLAAGLSLLQDVGHDRFGGLIIILFCVAAWIGVQHLGYAELGAAGRLILRGTFRGMVNAQVRLQEIERELSRAKTAEEAWSVILEGASDLGYTGVRLRIGDRLFDSLPGPAPENTWQMRVPLPDGQFLNLFHDRDRDIHPITVAAFPRLVEQSFLTRAFPVAEPAASGARFRVAASSNSL